MRKQPFTLATALLLSANMFAKTSPGLVRNSEQQRSGGISFTENKGQVHDQNYKPRPDVLYGVMAGNMAVHIKNNGVSYQLHRVDKYKEADNPITKKKKQVIDQQTIYRIDLTWLNANTNFTKTEDEAIPGYNNYYLKSCPNGALQVKSYKGITINNLYEGINLHYYEKNGDLKHDYIVAAHVDYKQIQLRVEGADISFNKDGSLIFTTPLGKVREGAPIVFQNGKQLKARWLPIAIGIKNNILSFEIENYNPGYELIIDPVTRLWGTYYGESQDDQAYSCATDASGNVYMSGETSSNTTGTAIATVGSHQSAFAGYTDAFLVKFDANGTRQWGTYYGGSGYVSGYSCATDAGGNVYLAGSADLVAGMVISTAGSHQPAFGGGNYDAFLVKFNSSGIRQWGTYYGGASGEDGYSCATDGSGNVYLAGCAGPVTGTAIASIGSHQPVYGGGGDAFLVKFNSSGVRQWGTYYGGTGLDVGLSCTTDAGGNVYLAGRTNSNTGVSIATGGSHQPAFGGGVFDAFLVKFNSSGTRQWGTYYGGSGGDGGSSCATDATGNVYLAGGTESNTGIATGSSHQAVFGGSSDAFLAKFNGSGIMQWGTYYGGPGNSTGSSCTTDATGNVFLAGTTNTGTIMATPGCHQAFNQSGAMAFNFFDAFLVKFNGSGTRQSSTYYGDYGEENGHSCATDALGNVYLSGSTRSFTVNSIATAGSHQSSAGGSFNEAFLVKFAACSALTVQPFAINGNTIVCSGSGANAYSTATVAGATFYIWSLPAGWSVPGNSNTISVTPGSSGIFTLMAGSACGASPQQTLNITVNATPTIVVNKGKICRGESFLIIATGAITYTFSGGPLVSPTVTSSYSVTGTSAAGCVSSNTAVSNVTVNLLPYVNASTNNTLICAGQNATLTASGASTFIFNPGGAGANITVSPTVTTSYTVTGTTASGCRNTAVITQSVDACTGLNSEILNQQASGVFKIYPNPTREIINLELNSENEVIIINAIGQIVYSYQLSSGHHQLNLENLAGGIYVVKVGSAAGSKNIKMIKE